MSSFEKLTASAPVRRNTQYSATLGGNLGQSSLAVTNLSPGCCSGCWILVEILNRAVWKSEWFLSPNTAAFILKIYSPVWAMTQNAEGKVMVVNSGKLLEREMKRPDNRSGDGERGEREGQ